ncbi:hypothetical protein CBL_20201, partial [Carabus blaptoides fortunei]
MSDLDESIESDTTIVPDSESDGKLENMDTDIEADDQSINSKTAEIGSSHINNTTGSNNKAKVTNRIKRKHNCYYCSQEVGNFSRHLERKHSDEIEVEKFMVLKRNSKNRKKIIDRLRREGDFCTTNIVPVMNKTGISPNNYICCKYCRGYYIKASLRRHVKKCYFNPDPSKRTNAQQDGHTLMAAPFGPNDILKISGLLNMMKADETSLVAKKDNIICEVARRYIKSHREKHQLLVAKRYMRRLARLVIAVRKNLNNVSLNLIDLLNPHSFKDLIIGTKAIAEYDEKERVFKSPSLALQMGTLLKHATNTAISQEMQKEKENFSQERLHYLQALISLIETDWALEISSEAGQNLQINKFNKPSLIPIAEDIKKFDMYLNNLIKNAKIGLAENSGNVKAYRNLLDGIFCSLMIFNKRRVGELQRMTLISFLRNYDTVPSSEFQKALTNSEKILYKSLKRIVIRGKRGRGVPVLFDKKTVESIELFISIRNNFDLKDNEYFFGIPGTKNPIAGYSVMRKHANFALDNQQRASLLTSTRLRKQLATITQIFKMEKNELEQLAAFMGHTEKTHAQFYRLPDDIYQTAKISKLLLLSKEGAIERFKGKSLEEMEIDLNMEEDESEDEDEYIREINEPLSSTAEDNGEVEIRIEDTQNLENVQINRVKGGKKRILIPWTNEQKKLTEKYFINHIKKKIVPKKHEVMKLKEMHPGIFQNKPYTTIKARSGTPEWRNNDSVRFLDEAESTADLQFLQADSVLSQLLVGNTGLLEKILVPEPVLLNSYFFRVSGSVHNAGAEQFDSQRAPAEDGSAPVDGKPARKVVGPVAIVGLAGADDAAGDAAAIAGETAVMGAAGGSPKTPSIPQWSVH